MSRPLELQLMLGETARAPRGSVSELVVDNFAGGGGASTGIASALGRPVDIAINHDPIALAMHQRNHPETRHYCENIFDVDPKAVCDGRPVGLAWFSPDCTHFSRAKGATPRKKEIRCLAWVVLRWAAAVRPRVIILENVPEFEDWGPLTAQGQPCKRRKGQTFQQWVGHLRNLGYAVEWRALIAADYGAPTSRKRLFLVARCDGAPIAWPSATHGPGMALRYRTAAECIDWSLPCPSIFERSRPLAENTLARIAAGVRRFVLEDPAPFVVNLTHGARLESLGEPMRTVTAAHRGEKALVSPFITSYYGPKRDGECRGFALDTPVPTQTTENRFGLVAPLLVRHFGRSMGQRCDSPAPTTTAGGQGHTALCAPVLMKNNSGNGPDSVQSPLATVTTGNRHYLTTAFLAKHYGGVVGHGMARPLGTVTQVDHHSLVTAFMTKFYGTSVGASMTAPCPSVTSGGNHLGEVRAFLVKYYKASRHGQVLTEPMHTLTQKARLGLVTVQGMDYHIVDIGLRMLQPRELARAQGFPDSYVLEGTKAQRVAMIGNSVPPALAEVLVRSNYVAVASAPGRAVASR